MAKHQTDTSYGIIPLRRAGEGWRVLLVQHVAGHWGFPKGHPEADETPRQSAERELQEETGLHITQLLDGEAITQSYDFTTATGRVHKTVWYYLAEVTDTSVVVQAAEVRDYSWVSLAEARVLMPPNSDDLLQVITRRLDLI